MYIPLHFQLPTTKNYGVNLHGIIIIVLTTISTRELARK